MAPVGQQVRFKISPYICPRFQNDTGSEVWGFCVFYRQVAGIGFLPCCKWRSVSAHRSLTRLIHLLFKFRKYAPHALKGQKLLAQGIALGIMAISKAPCKGKSFVYCLVFEGFCPYYYICTWKCVLRQNRVRYWLYLIDFCRNF